MAPIAHAATLQKHMPPHVATTPSVASIKHPFRKDPENNTLLLWQFVQSEKYILFSWPILWLFEEFFIIFSFIFQKCLFFNKAKNKTGIILFFLSYPFYFAIGFRNLQLARGAESPRCAQSPWPPFRRAHGAESPWPPLRPEPMAPVSMSKTRFVKHPNAKR